jgi:hypothetical protein
MCVVGADTQRADEVWIYCCREPISEAVYRSVCAGERWPDDAPLAKNHVERTGDVHTDLLAELAAERELAESLLRKPIATKDQADSAAVWAKRVAAIKSRADGQHKVEKQPHLDAGRDVDNKWRDIREGAESLAKQLKRHLDTWLIEQDRQEKERQRKARDEADRIQREADEAARRAEEVKIKAEAGIASDFERETAAEADRLADMARAAQRDTEARTTGAGRTGARVALHTYYVARIVDYSQLVLALQTEPEVREAVEKIANRIARTKDAPMPAGAERVEDRRAA